MAVPKKRSFALAVLLGSIAAVGAAQVPQMERGPAQERLDFLVGSWRLESRSHFRGETQESVSRAEIEWLPGGVWLEASLDLDTPIGRMFGSARIAWDEAKSEYVRHWMDNQSAVVLTQRGSFVDDDTLELSGSFDWVDGRTFYQRIVVERLADGWSETSYMGLSPADLKLNHEARAYRTPGSAAAPEAER